MRLAPATAWITLAASFILASPAAAEKLKSFHLCDFEDIPMLKWSDTVYDIPTALKKPNYPSNDYGWNTGGYARMEPAEKKEAYREKKEDLGAFMRGKYSVKVRFTIPSEFRVMGTEDDPKSWESGMTLSTETATKLEFTDWSKYKSLTLDVYNPSPDARTLTIRISDSGSSTYTKTQTFETGAWTMEIILKKLDHHRLKLSDIRSLTVLMDTALLTEAPELYFDNLQLNNQILGKGEGSQQGLNLANVKMEGEEEEEFEFDDDDDEELSEEYLKKYGGRFKQAASK